MDLTTMQGLTPTITVKVPNTVDLTQAAGVYPSIKQGGRIIRPQIFDVDEHQVDVYLTQEDTLSLVMGPAEIQLNWVFATGQRAATRPNRFNVLSNHILEVLP